MKNEREVSRAVAQYADMIRRICLLHLKNHTDTEDVFQTVFLKYMLYSGAFENAEHEKAWLIRVTSNACRDWLRDLRRRTTVPLELMAEEPVIPPEEHGLLGHVLSLPEKYKTVVYLFYYEGYSAVEIARMLYKRENTVYSLLSRARAMLRERMGGDLLV